MHPARFAARRATSALARSGPRPASTSSPLALHLKPKSRALSSLTHRNAGSSHSPSRLVANDPFALVNDLFPSLLSDVFTPAVPSSLRGPFSDGLALDVSETEKEYLVKADVPGVKKEEVSLSVKDDVLTISGERTTSTDESNEHRHIVERAYGRFSRSIQLPKDANPDEISATMEDGVLKLTITKRPAPPDEGRKKIPIS
ncbi:HSP20-like chaperone [Zopfochytrium polystomum]|nr:HSP20-like chaperone [Zopfochytrium polystomum]